jgi:GNAT superfamily N-acetyltransferase
VSAASVRVEALNDEQWPLWRDLRLEALADTPIGFGELLENAVLKSDEDWQEVLKRPGLKLLAWEAEQPVGMGGGFRRDDGTPVLYAVYVQPAARGGSVLAVLVERVAAWCAPEPLVLDVHVDNDRAHAAYLKLGFVDTGGRTPGGGIDGRGLVEMSRV